MSCSSPWALVAQTAEQALGITDDMRFLFRRIAIVAGTHDGLGTEVRDEWGISDGFVIDTSTLKERIQLISNRNMYRNNQIVIGDRYFWKKWIHVCVLYGMDHPRKVLTHLQLLRNRTIRNVNRLHMPFFHSKMEMLDGSANVDWCPTLFTESGRLFTQSAADS